MIGVDRGFAVRFFREQRLSFVGLAGPVALIVTTGIAAKEASAATRPALSTICALDTLQVIGQFQHVPGGLALFGDSDHDGAGEVRVYEVSGGLVDIVRVLERAPSGQLNPVFSVSDAIPLTIDDIDQDGRVDLVAQFGSSIRVHEAADSMSHPSLPVWQGLRDPVDCCSGFGGD